MARGGRRIRGRAPSADYWPGFVDAMSSLLLVLIFLITIFMLTQFILTQTVTSKDTALEALKDQIAALTSQLSIGKRENADLRATIYSLQESLASSTAERDRLNGLVSRSQGEANQIPALQTEIDKQKKISSDALSQVELLNQQISAMRRQLAALEDALNASEQKDKESQAQIVDLGKRLNAALAQKVQELAKYRSEFFGRLREILGDRPDITIVGDRFVIQSEIFFASGSADISPGGRQQLARIADAVSKIASEIPRDIPWVLRVDGHTDAHPIKTAQYPSNWYLSTARAIAVVNDLQARGVPPEHLVAAGFGEYQPLVQGNNPDAAKKNRRIEFKLTEK